MGDSIRITLAQMTSTTSHNSNVALLEDIVTKAVSDQTTILALPEVVGLMNKNYASLAKSVKKAEQDPYLKACKRLARDHQIWIQAGSTPVKGPQNKLLNHATLINSCGRIVASYNKLHLFDVFLDGESPTGESKRYEPGTKAVLVETPFGPIGMTICYDIRFPQLYRDLAKAGALLCFVPSAFTIPTGKAHWEVLLRARAIENGMWMIAAAQVGSHEDGRETWGHSMVISPWGEVILELSGEKSEIKTVEIDLTEVASTRRQIPSLQSDSFYELSKIPLV